jgi:hypothetical protein
VLWVMIRSGTASFFTTFLSRHRYSKIVRFHKFYNTIRLAVKYLDVVTDVSIPLLAGLETR